MLERMDDILGFLSFFFSHFARDSFQRIWKVFFFLFVFCLFGFFFVRILLLLSCFWKVWLKRWKLEYQRCLYHAWSSISHWERLPLRSHYGIFLKEKAKLVYSWLNRLKFGRISTQPHIFFGKRWFSRANLDVPLRVHLLEIRRLGSWNTLVSAAIEEIIPMEARVVFYWHWNWWGR